MTTENTSVELISPQDFSLQLQSVKPSKIAELAFVKNKFLRNFAATHRSNDMDKVNQEAERVYANSVLHFTKIVSESDALSKCDPLSLYACFSTSATMDASFDPLANELSLVPLKGKAALWPQASLKVRRIIQTKQAKFFEQTRFIYQGDVIKIVNGRVDHHEETFQNETIVGAYVRVVLDEKGSDRYFIYRKSDWEAWRKKSPQPNGENWNDPTTKQPNPGFLRTKITSHACSEKCWASGRTSAVTDEYAVIIEDPDFDASKGLAQNASACNDVPVAPFETPTTVADEKITLPFNADDNLSTSTKATLIEMQKDTTVDQAPLKFEDEDENY